MIDGAPKEVPLTVDLHENLIQVPSPLARLHALEMPLPDLRSEHRPEPVPPKPHRLVADVDSPHLQQAFYFPERKPICFVTARRLIFGLL